MEGKPMRPRRNENPQWRVGLVVYHGPNFGHRIEIETQRQGQETQYIEAGSWKGIGVPKRIAMDASVLLEAIVMEHLEHRYGIQEELFPF
jgi:hypothetical protein